MVDRRSTAGRNLRCFVLALSALVPALPALAQGIWISQDEIDRLPKSGPPWEAILRAADRSDYGEPTVAQQDNGHDTKILAAALAYAGTQDEGYRTRAVQGLMAVIGTEDGSDPDCSATERPPEYGEGPPGVRSMALGRALAAYCIAADVLNFRAGGFDPEGQGTQWEAWADAVRFRVNCPNNGGNWKNLSEVHDEASSNGNSMAGGARVACAAYLGDDSEIEKAWLTFRRFCGDRTVGPDLRINYPSWMHDPQLPVAINPEGATKEGHRIDGVIVSDQGRGGEFQWPPGYTSYPWDGLLGLTVQAAILHRQGRPAWEAGDQALRRAVDYQYFLREATGDARWADADRASPAIWLVNAAYGTGLAVELAGEDKNIAWTDWTHGSVPDPPADVRSD